MLGDGREACRGDGRSDVWVHETKVGVVGRVLGESMGVWNWGGVKWTYVDRHTGGVPVGGVGLDMGSGYIRHWGLGGGHGEVRASRLDVVMSDNRADGCLHYLSGRLILGTIWRYVGHESRRLREVYQAGCARRLSPG